MSMTAIIEDIRARLDSTGHECGIEEVAAKCSNLSWNQVFLAVDLMSRTGQVQLRLDPSRGYRVALLPNSQSRSDRISIVA